MKELRRILYSLLCVCLLSTLIVIKHKSDSTPNSYSSNNEINTTDNSTDVLLEAHNTTKAKELYKKISLHKKLKKQSLSRRKDNNIENLNKKEETVINDIKEDIKAEDSNSELVTNIYFITSNNNFITESIQNKVKSLLGDKISNNEIKIIQEDFDLNSTNINRFKDKIQKDKNDKVLVTFSQSAYEVLAKDFENAKIVIPLLLSTSNLKNNEKLSFSKNTLGIRAPIAHKAMTNLIKNSFNDKKLIVLYNGLEQESLHNFSLLKDILESQKVPYIKFSIKNKNDIDNLSILKSDAKDSVVLLVTSNLFLNNNKKISSDFEKMKMPVVTFSELELQKFNAIISLGVDYDVIAQQTYDKITTLLQNKEIKSDNDRVELAKLYNLIVNNKHAKQLNIIIPEGLIKDANKVIK